MKRPFFTRKRRVVWLSILISAGLFWALGRLTLTAMLVSSPDGRFVVRVVYPNGWRRELPWKFHVYVTDTQTGDSILASEQSAFCCFNGITLADLRWTDNHHFLCIWAVEDGPSAQQNFVVSASPYKVKADPMAGCC